MTIDYDASADTMYLIFRKSHGPCDYAENGKGQILKVEASSSEIIGVTIPMFSHRITTGEMTIDEIDSVNTKL